MYSLIVSIQKMLHVIQIYPNGARAISIGCQKSCFVLRFRLCGGRPEGSTGIRTGSGGLPWVQCVLIRVFAPLVTLTLSENHVIDQRRRYACNQVALISSPHFQKSADEANPKVSHLRASSGGIHAREAWYFHPLDLGHVCIDRVGWVGWIGSGRY